MKITDIRVHPVQAPGRTLVVVLVDTDAGLTGVGEAGLQRRWQAIAGAVEHLKRWLIGRDPGRIEFLWQEMFRGGFYPADRVVGSALSAIDIALWDIKGQVLKAPVYDLLGGRCRDYVECFFQPGYLSPFVEHPPDSTVEADGGGSSTSAVVAAARRHVAEGLRYFRLSPQAQSGVFHPQRAVQELLAALRAVRDAVGDELELMVDLHGRLDPPDAAWFCRQCEPLRMFVVEDPLRSEHPAAYRRLREQTAVPLAAGEQWANKWEFRVAIEEELVNYVRPDLCIAGGLTESRKIAALAEAHFVKLLLHNPLGPVCTAVCLHLHLACDNAGPQEVLWPPQAILPDVFECDFRLERDRLTIPTAPGIGVQFNADAARRYPAEMTEPPHWRREDGSYTNY